MKLEVNINTEILTWAIDRAGFDFEEFTEKVPSIIDWIEGRNKPTLKQLEDFSKKVYLPFGYLFLTEPPQEKLPIPFFRSNGDITEKVSINVYDTILLLQQRQDWLKNYLIDNEFEELPFVGRYHDSQDVFTIVNDIRDELGLTKNWASSFKTWKDALNNLIEVIEDKGIITVFNGVVENNPWRPISVDDCRGFVLVDKIAPFLFVNNADGKAAQMFTIAHELAHIWTGFSAGFDFRRLEPANDSNERLCDQIAAELLVPKTEFIKVWESTQSIKDTSNYFKVSEIVIARRALDTKKISRKEFFQFYEKYKNQVLYIKEKKPGGGIFYATASKRLSVKFATHVNTAVKSGQLLYRDACKLTSMKGDTFNNYFANHL